MELYFKCENLDKVFSKLGNSGVILIHPIEEQPLGQRVIRFYDPDNHIAEIGEPLSAVIRRYLEEGLPEEEMINWTSVPIKVERIKSKKSK